MAFVIPSDAALFRQHTPSSPPNGVTPFATSTSPNPSATRLVKLLLTLNTEINTLATKESELNALIYTLYHHTPDEIAMVDAG